MDWSRRGLLYLAAASGATLVTGCRGFGAPPAPSRPPPLRVRGGDLSFLPQEEEAGAVFTDAGEVLPLEQILARRGATHVRLRLWVDPVGGTNDLESMLAMGRRAHRAGLELYLTLHLSDTWADVKSQAIPAAWAGQGLAELAASVENYTRNVVNAFARQGTPLAMIQLGNEVDNGMLWPLGWVSATTADGWDSFLTLLRAALRGATTPASGSAARTVMHLSAGTDAARCRQFLDRVTAAGVGPDIIGLSYYPFWNGSLAALEGNLTAIAGRYSRDVIVAETAYPWTLKNADRTDNVVTRSEQLPDLATCPPTVAGQQAYYERLRQVLQRVPGSRAAGFTVWAPDWLAGVGLTPTHGATYDNLTLFDHRGRGLPALSCFRPPD